MRLIITREQSESTAKKQQELLERMALADHVYAASEKDLEEGLHDTRDDSNETREADQHIEALEELDRWEAVYERQGE